MGNKLLKVNISNLPASKSAYWLMFSVFESGPSKKEAIQKIAKKLYMKEGTARKAVDHLRIFGFLKSDSGDYSLSKEAIDFLKEKISFKEMLIQLVLKDEDFLFGNFVRFIPIFSLVIGFPISKKKIAEVISIFSTDRKDQSAVRSVYRNLCSVLPILEELGLIVVNKSLVYTLPEQSKQEAWKRLRLPDLSNDFKSMSDVGKREGDVFYIFDELRGMFSIGTTKEIINSISQVEGLFYWEPTSQIKDKSVIDQYGSNVRYFKNVDDL